MPSSLCLRQIDTRILRVKNFVKYLVFYRIDASGIDVIRVLHVARDIEGILDEEC